MPKKDFIFLLLLSIAGAGFSYLLVCAMPVMYDWLKFSAIAVVIFVAAVVIVFGVFLVWCCAKYGEHQANKTRKLYLESIANYDDQDYN